MTFARNLEEERERKAAGKKARLAALLTKPAVAVRGQYANAGVFAPLPKAEKTQASAKEVQAHKKALVELGCMACRRLFPWAERGPVELHHLRGGGWGKGDYLTLIPLCVEHHRGDSGVHGLGVKGFPKRYGFDQADMLADALALVNRAMPIHGD